MLESDWLTNILRWAIIFSEMHDERRFQAALLTTLHEHTHFAKWFRLFQLTTEKYQNPHRHWYWVSVERESNSKLVDVVCSTKVPFSAMRGPIPVWHLGLQQPIDVIDYENHRQWFSLSISRVCPPVHIQLQPVAQITALNNAFLWTKCI